MATTTLKVPDISCAHCEKTIKETLTPVQGVSSVEVDIPAKSVRVDYDDAAVTIDRFKELLADEEYPVESAS